MRKKKTIKKTNAIKVSFILDETGSMLNYKDTTMSGFNEYIDGLKKQPKLRMTLTTFNTDKIKIVYKDKPIKDVKHLNDDTYQPGACTPLYDAMGRTINSLGKEKKVLMIIMTDGLENASNEYTQKGIFDLIKKKEKAGWTFVYLGANQDAWAVSRKMGFARMNTVSYDEVNIKEAFKTVGRGTSCYAASAGVQTANFFDKDDEGKLN